jgi:hypothetical protein
LVIAYVAGAREKKETNKKSLAIKFSILSGIFNSFSIISVFISLAEAKNSHANIGIICTIVSGASLFGIFSSYFIYGENFLK